MKNYEINETKEIPFEQLFHLYQSAGGTDYTKESEKLTEGVKHSLKVLTA